MALTAGGVLVAAALAYGMVLRPWTHSLGATRSEVAAAMPGDEIVRAPFVVTTRAITIRAAPEHVWPWLLQIGSGRAGWYTYDHIDNGGVPSSDTIIPTLQHLVVGDVVPMVPGKNVGVWVKDLVPRRSMLWWDQRGDYTWSWQLVPTADRGTRLITRVRARFPWDKPLYGIVADVGDVVMTRKMLRGIRARAERLEGVVP